MTPKPYDSAAETIVNTNFRLGREPGYQDTIAAMIIGADITRVNNAVKATASIKYGLSNINPLCGQGFRPAVFGQQESSYLKMPDGRLSAKSRHSQVKKHAA